MTVETELTRPNTKHPFFITVDASLVGLSAVLFQMNEENKMRVISYNSRILNTQEQKLSTLDRELLAIVYALQIYEFLIIGSPHPIYIFTDHKPLLHCFDKRGGNLSPRFYRAQMQLTKYSKQKLFILLEKLSCSRHAFKTLDERTTSNTSITTQTIATPNRFLYHER